MDDLADTSPLAIPVRYVITLIHGTWAKKAAWYEESSELCRNLQSTLPGGSYFYKFKWTGRNSVLGRRDAAKQLAADLQCLQLRFPQAVHFIIAHSHGGNIAYYSMRNLPQAVHIKGVICLSTPFLYAKIRHLMPFANMNLFISFVAYQYLIIGMFASFKSYLGLLVGPVSLTLFVAWKKPLRELATRLENELQLPIVRHPILIVRSKLDEALGALVGTRLVTVIMAKLWSFIMLPLSLAGKFNAHLWTGKWTVRGIIITLLGIFILQPVITDCDNTFTWHFIESPQIQVFNEDGNVIDVIEPRGPNYIECVSPQEVRQYGLLGMVLGIPLTLFKGYFMLWTTFLPILFLFVVTGVFSLGIKTTLSHIFLDISAKGLPPGPSDQFICSSTSIRNLSLRHSQSYQDPQCIKHICDWIKQRMP